MPVYESPAKRCPSASDRSPETAGCLTSCLSEEGNARIHRIHQKAGRSLA
jgi:hypothetical protein